MRMLLWRSMNVVSLASKLVDMEAMLRRVITMVLGP